MKMSGRKGFVLILVLAVMGLFGSSLILLTAGTNNLRHQADSAYLSACQENLLASGMAWARHQVKTGGKALPSGATALDTTNWDSPGAELSIRSRAGEGGGLEIELHAVCKRGARTFTREWQGRVSQ